MVWPEAFAVPDKTGETVADLIIDQGFLALVYNWLQIMEQKMSIK